MGRMKDFLASFCEAIYPKDFDKQDQLFVDMMRANGDPLERPTIESFRVAYEGRGEMPTVSLSDMQRIIEEAKM